MLRLRHTSLNSLFIHIRLKWLTKNYISNLNSYAYFWKETAYDTDMNSGSIYSYKLSQNFPFKKHKHSVLYHFSLRQSWWGTPNACTVFIMKETQKEELRNLTIYNTQPSLCICIDYNYTVSVNPTCFVDRIAFLLVFLYNGLRGCCIHCYGSQFIMQCKRKWAQIAAKTFFSHILN